jgi:hypothetical protein
MVGALVGELALTSPQSARSQGASPPTSLTSRNASGELRTVFLNGAFLDLHNQFFKSLGTNGRACVTCHAPEDAWTITPRHARRRFIATGGRDPLFAPVDGTNSPNADRSTLRARWKASSMLLRKGLIRVGIGIPDDAEFTLEAVDDPYGFASASELSLFRRPIPSTNLRFITAVMWEGRESMTQTGTSPLSAALTDEQNRANLIADLKHQANGATRGHAQAAFDLTEAQQQAIVDFEMSLATAQQSDKRAGALDRHGAQGGPANLAIQPFYLTINDVFGADHFGHPFDPSAMTLYNGWLHSANPHRAQVARGAVLFNTKPILITGVAGLNDDLKLPVIPGTCTSCHDAPNVGNHSVSLALNIGLSDASRRTPDMPLYTLRNKQTGETVQTTDPGRALITGQWADIGKFKGPLLRGLAARAPYFHNGLAASLEEAVDFYDTRFHIGFTKQEKADLVAFLKTL